MEEVKCPICGSKAFITKTYDFQKHKWYKCELCGFFALKSFRFKLFNFEKYSMRNKLIYAIRNLSSENNYVEIDRIEQLDEIICRVNYPVTIEQKTDILLKYIIENEDGLNAGCFIEGKKYIDFALESEMDIPDLIEYASQRDLIIRDNIMTLADGGAHCTLTPEGRVRLNEMDQQSKRNKNNVVEIKRNTHFSETMLKALETAENEISKDNPEHAHDRMHTFLHDYLIQLCTKLSLPPNSNKPDIMELFSLIQQHLNMNNPNKIIVKILRSFSSALHDINIIRNDESLSHPNRVLEKPEAMFVINTIKTIYVYLEEKLN